MQRIAKFEKVSFEQFKKDWQGEHPQDTEEGIREIYDGIRLPKRATAGSAGYDFFAPAAFTLKAGEMTKILTGIRARIDDGWVLKLYPRSGLGFKFRLQLNNTVGIIDSDYYGSDNEGHIQVKLTNDSREGKTVEVEAGTGFSQGIFAAQRHATAKAALERVGLGNKLKNLPNQLSGGQQQRVSIARALARGPAVILADEPTGALDSHTSREVLGMLQDLHKQGNTVVLITHDNSIAVQAERIIRLEDGRVVYDGDAHAPEQSFSRTS